MMIAIWVLQPQFLAQKAIFDSQLIPEVLKNLGSDQKGFAFGSSGKKARE